MTLNHVFSGYELAFKKMVNGGVDGIARERERLEAATEHTVTEVDRLDDRLHDRTIGVVSLVLLIAVTAVGVIVVAGGLWMGTSLLGISAAVPEMWERAWAAKTWWSGLAWGLGAVTLMLTMITAIATSTVWVRKWWPVKD